VVELGDLADEQAEGLILESLLVVFAAAEFLREDALQLFVVLAGQRDVMCQVVDG